MPYHFSEQDIPIQTDKRATASIQEEVGQIAESLTRFQRVFSLPDYSTRGNLHYTYRFSTSRQQSSVLLTLLKSRGTNSTRRFSNQMALYSSTVIFCLSRGCVSSFRLLASADRKTRFLCCRKRFSAEKGCLSSAFVASPNRAQISKRKLWNFAMFRAATTRVSPFGVANSERANAGKGSEVSPILSGRRNACVKSDCIGDES